MKLFDDISQAGSRLWQRRWLLTGFVLLVGAVFICYHVLFTANGIIEYRQKETEYNNLQQEVQRLQQENESLQKSNDALKNDPKAIEQAARDKLRYTKPGEIIYVLPQPKPQPQPPAEAKK